LSCLSVLWPIKTASPNERWRNKCILSSREVKSTGEKFRVVIFPSTVMAKVTTTNGRSDFRGNDVDLCADLFRFADLMFESSDLALHLAQFHAFHFATRFVKEVNDAAGKAAE